MTYLIFRACERFNILPSAFYNLDQEEQYALVAYEDLRRKEEIEEVKRVERKMSSQQPIGGYKPPIKPTMRKQ